MCPSVRGRSRHRPEKSFPLPWNYFVFSICFLDIEKTFFHLRYCRWMRESPPLWGTARGSGLIWTLTAREGDKLPQRALSPDSLH